MSQKQIKRFRRTMRKMEDQIKVEGLQEFRAFANKQSFRRRWRIAWKIIFKRL